MKLIIRFLGIYRIIRIAYYLYLKLDYETCAEMPQVKDKKKRRLKNYTW